MTVWGSLEDLLRRLPQETMAAGHAQDRQLPAVYFPVGYNDSASDSDSTPYSDSGFSTPGEGAEYASSADSTGSEGSDYFEHYLDNIQQEEGDIPGAESAEDDEDAEVGAAARSRLPVPEVQ